jgi:hypothetical protein
MAIKSNVELNNGVVMSYHRVMETSTNYLSGQTTVKVASYVDETARRANKEPVQVREHQIALEGSDASLRETFYTLVMRAPREVEPVVLKEGETPMPPPPEMNGHLRWQFPSPENC